jgi:hypothetical protein
MVAKMAVEKCGPFRVSADPNRGMALGIQVLIQRSLVALFLVAAGLVGCSRAQAQQPLQAPPATFTDTLRKAAGEQPVFFLLSSGAVEARSADETMKRSIVPALVQEALYDAALDLLWVRREGRLEVVDLRKENPAPVPASSLF